MNRLDLMERQTSILKAAMTLANKKGRDYKSITRAEIAERANCSATLITHHFGTMNSFRRELIKFAVRKKNIKVIVQALMNNDMNKGEFCTLVDSATRDKIRKQFS